VSAAGSQEPATGRHGRIRLIGALLLAMLVLFIVLQGPGTGRVQGAWFDAHQALWPREVSALPVTIVAIDEKSLQRLGRWPWPRNHLAQLVRAIQRGAPAVIGINILMSEPDALSPERLLAQTEIDDPRLVEALRALPTHDAQLASAMAVAPTVLIVAGTVEPTQHRLRAAPVMVHALNQPAGGAAPAVPLYAGALGSIAELDKQANGWGLVSVEATRGVIRRMPLVASIDGTLLPSLAVEMLRVAQGAPALRLTVAGDRVERLTVGHLGVPTEGDGAVRVFFSPHMAQRFVSATDLLDGRFDVGTLRDRLVLIGLTGVALQEYQNTPIGERMSGSEIQAQLLENLVDGSTLRRPRWAPALEATVLLLLGGVMLWVVPRWRTHHAALLLLACLAATVLAGLAAFRSQQLLFDAITPSLGLLLFFGVLLALSLAETSQQSRTLQRLVQAQREDSARLSGELQAAQRVQTANLPSPLLLQADGRAELHATLQPAREVGGDLYDYFLLDARRLFILIGDVAGKGLSASIFMAVSKALYKNAMLRAPDADIGRIMRVANTEVSRDNPGSLFVTAFAAILDLDSGELNYCNAGHDNPYRLHPDFDAPQRIEDGDGPPLCALADYGYQGASCRLRRGELLCLITDGVTEAQNSAGELYGNQRLQQRLLALERSRATPRQLVADLQADVLAFAAGAEPADDLTILALRWHGPAGAGA
jgi:serine phosphatase RsbU (regulator of sigma subunit)/CHASE2 domain-containing sensor protein